MKTNKTVQKTTGFFKEFKEFISKGNVIDLAVGVIIGGAFSGIVKSLVENIITPAISILTKNIAFTDLFYALDGNEYATLAAAQEAGAATINYGIFIQGVIDFIITARKAKNVISVSDFLEILLTFVLIADIII